VKPLFCFSECSMSFSCYRRAPCPLQPLDWCPHLYAEQRKLLSLGLELEYWPAYLCTETSVWKNFYQHIKLFSPQETITDNYATVSFCLTCLIPLPLNIKENIHLTVMRTKSGPMLKDDSSSVWWDNLKHRED